MISNEAKEYAEYIESKCSKPFYTKEQIAQAFDDGSEAVVHLQTLTEMQTAIVNSYKIQIEKMKCCENCKFVSVVIGCVKNELMEGLSSNSKGYCKCDKWELAE